MTLKERLSENTDAFIRSVKDIPDNLFNTPPDENSWSPAGVAEHVYRSEFGISRLFKGKTSPLKDREPDSKVSEFELRLSNPSRMKASDIISPTPGKKDKDGLIEKFRTNRQAIGDLIGEGSLYEVCLLFEHPIYGFLTRSEWVKFSILHTERHMRQVENIKNYHNK
ncbi:MAG: DinB family protein [Balneolaceae bacterium]